MSVTVGMSCGRRGCATSPCSWRRGWPINYATSYWRQGSICEDFGALDCGVLLVGGWADGYTNGVDRALAGLDAAGVPCRGLVGPWSHAWPEVSDPGPRIGFLQECVRWWDHWLNGADNGVMDEPLLRAWIQEPIVPSVRQPQRPGRWVSEPQWPSPRIVGRRLFPSVDGELRLQPVASGRRGRSATRWPAPTPAPGARTGVRPTSRLTSAPRTAARCRSRPSR